MNDTLKNSYSILINTCDKFEDCWQPYFKLHAQYWPDCKGKLYLNTETKSFNYPDLEIVSLKVNGEDLTRKLTWSECLRRALDKIEDDIVLYMQEDYFIKSPVANDWVEKYVQLMNTDKSIDCIHITDQGPPGEVASEEYSDLWKVPRFHKDRISCQAALWRKKVLKEYIREYESAWNFEWFGSKRASILRHNIYVVNSSIVKLNSFEIIPYIFTGVIGGRWCSDVVELFQNHSIDIDFSHRGFFMSSNRTLLERFKSKIRRLPVEIRSRIGFLTLKIRSWF
jgi:hypothetical protein